MKHKLVESQPNAAPQPLEAPDCLPPLLRWAGSKRQIVQLLHEALPRKFNRYYEPFAGSACLYFRVRPNRATLSDANAELINLYQRVRAEPDELFAAIRSMKPSRRSYYRIRRLQSSALSTTERAARMVILNRYCFNGLYRTDSNGNFNVPRGGGRTGMLPSVDHLRNIAAALKTARLIECDFEESLDAARKGDIAYLDPPYAATKVRSFTGYCAKPFDISDLARLSKLLANLDKRGVKFLLSYRWAKEAKQIIGDKWNTRRLIVNRHVAGFASFRKRAAEMLVSNY